MEPLAANVTRYESGLNLPIIDGYVQIDHPDDKTAALQELQRLSALKEPGATADAVLARW